MDMEQDRDDMDMEQDRDDMDMEQDSFDEKFNAILEDLDSDYDKFVANQWAVFSKLIPSLVVGIIGAIINGENKIAVGFKLKNKRPWNSIPASQKLDFPDTSIFDVPGLDDIHLYLCETELECLWPDNQIQKQNWFANYPKHLGPLNILSDADTAKYVACTQSFRVFEAYDTRRLAIYNDRNAYCLDPWNKNHHMDFMIQHYNMIRPTFINTFESSAFGYSQDYNSRRDRSTSEPYKSTSTQPGADIHSHSGPPVTDINVVTNRVYREYDIDFETEFQTLVTNWEDKIGGSGHVESAIDINFETEFQTLITNWEDEIGTVAEGDIIRPFEESDIIGPFEQSDIIRPFEESDIIHPVEESDMRRPGGFIPKQVARKAQRSRIRDSEFDEKFNSLLRTWKRDFGEDGQDGQDGEDGEDGQDGEDGFNEEDRYMDIEQDRDAILEDFDENMNSDRDRDRRRDDANFDSNFDGMLAAFDEDIDEDMNSDRDKRRDYANFDSNFDAMLAAFDEDINEDIDEDIDTVILSTITNVGIEKFCLKEIKKQALASRANRERNTGDYLKNRVDKVLDSILRECETNKSDMINSIVREIMNQQKD